MALPLSEATRATAGLLARRQGPEDFPYSVPLARALGGAAALAGALELALQTNVVAALVASGVQVVVIYFLLGRWLKQLGLANRLPQTFAALMAVTAVLDLVEWPIAAVLLPVVRANNAALMAAGSVEEMMRVAEGLPSPPALPTLGLVAVVTWGALVKLRLLERALNAGFWRAAWQLTVLLLVASLLGGLVASPLITDVPAAPARATPARPSAKPAPASVSTGAPGRAAQTP